MRTSGTHGDKGRWATYTGARNGLADRLLHCVGVGESTGFYPTLHNRKLATHGLVFVSVGQGLFWPNGSAKAIRVDAPAVLWLRPGMTHGYGPTTDGWTEHWVLFTGPSVGAFELLFPESAIGQSLPVGSRALASIPLFSRLADLLDSPHYAGAIQGSIVCQQILVDILTSAVDMTDGAADSSLVDALRLSARESLSVADRARRAGVSAGFLRRSVRAATGLGPNEFIAHTRVAEAQSLLVETSWSISEISSALGYSDASYFSRQFRHLVGVSPAQFRSQEVRAPRNSEL